MVAADEGARRRRPEQPGESVRRRIEDHVGLERELLDAYASLDIPPGYVRYLIDLLMEEERRHHGYFADIADALARTATEPAAPVVRAGALHTEELLVKTAALRAFEEHDQAELASLGRSLKQFSDTRLSALLVELMELDTQKHIKILDFIAASATEVARQDRDAARADSIVHTRPDPLAWP